MIQPVDSGTLQKYFPGITTLGILRLDLPDPVAGGNKSFKLKYHLEAFRNSGAKCLLTFGGAFSNHIAATAHAGKVNDIRTIGIIRGEELNPRSNKVLAYANERGMQLQFVSREKFGQRYSEKYHKELAQQLDAYVVPEGGGGEEGARGCMEILNTETDAFDEIVLPVGTGTTCEGIRRTLKAGQRVHGIDIVNPKAEYSLGGYAKSSPALTGFIFAMKNEMQLPLDHVYSGKTLFALHNITKAGFFHGKNVLFIHTGGYAFVD